MSEHSEQYLNRAIDALSQSDPLIKLLEEVRLGRVKSSDAGLRVIIESWLQTYRKILENGKEVSPSLLKRLNPGPRLEVLIESGIMPTDHTDVVSLRRTYDDLVGRPSSVA